MVYMFLAEGFEEIEALCPLDLLRRAGVDIKTVGIGSKNICGAHGIGVVADMSDNEIFNSAADMIILPGGMPGTLNLEADPILRVCIDYCFKNNKLIGAICAAPSILGHLGMLKNKNAVCFPGFESELLGAEVSKTDYVIKDGNIITAKGAGVALEFGLSLANELAGEMMAKKIRAAIQMRK